MKTITLQNNIKANIYHAEVANSFAIYLHGGGIIYGSRVDIPRRLVEILNEQHTTVISLDYLLAPNASLDEILEMLFVSFYELRETYFTDLPYKLCGRSAGSYLMFKLTEYILDQGLTAPTRLINFYGYNDLHFYKDRSIKVGSRTLSAQEIKHIDTHSHVSEDSNFSRFPLYAYALQQGLALEYLQVDKDNLESYAVSDETLSNFPPTFSTASTSDAEVPFKYSKEIAKKIPNSKFIPVYYLEHDFLRNVGDSSVDGVFEKLETWLRR